MIALVFTWIGIIAMPHISTYAGWSDTWRGFAGAKNAFGKFAGFGTITFFFVRLACPGWRRFAEFGLLLAIPCLIMSHSRSSWLSTMAGVLVGFYCYRFFGQGRITGPLKLMFGFNLAAFALIVVVSLAEHILGLLGRGLDFSNRTEIWEAAIAQGLEHPFLGAGYGAFWTEAGASDLFYKFFVRVGNGHNGYLDLWLELGFLGLGAFVLCVITTMSRLSRRLTSTNGRDSVTGFFVAVCTATLVVTVSEKVIMLHTNLVWALFVAVPLYLSPAVLGRQSRRSATHLFGLVGRTRSFETAPFHQTTPLPKNPPGPTAM